jgi:hypothetical protein
MSPAMKARRWTPTSWTFSKYVKYIYIYDIAADDDVITVCEFPVGMVQGGCEVARGTAADFSRMGIRH